MFVLSSIKNQDVLGLFLLKLMNGVINILVTYKIHYLVTHNPVKLIVFFF